MPKELGQNFSMGGVHFGENVVFLCFAERSFGGKSWRVHFCLLSAEIVGLNGHR
jgi:hypothetical protein